MDTSSVDVVGELCGEGINSSCSSSPMPARIHSGMLCKEEALGLTSYCPGGIDPINEALVQKQEEDDIIAEHAESMHCRHFDNKCEQVIDECVHESVNHTTT